MRVRGKPLIPKKILARPSELEGHAERQRLRHTVSPLVNVERICSPFDSLHLDTWYNNLPEGLTISARSATKPLPNVIVLNIAYWWLLLLLHRPFYARTLRSASNASTDIPSSFTDLSVKICDRATVKIVHLVMLFEKCHGMRYFPLSMLQVHAPPLSV
jgi:hypothetical protein